MDPKLVGEILRRLLRRYQERLLPEDYHRRVLDQVIEDLPGIIASVTESPRKART
ncbi:MAG TPA: hypothetical protein VMU12_02060 [Candidatus Paceibacterota bacterium]|nr:hypothetical protein [Candidatus Paceibacterota bacterium]